MLGGSWAVCQMTCITAVRAPGFLFRLHHHLISQWSCLPLAVPTLCCMVQWIQAVSHTASASVALFSMCSKRVSVGRAASGIVHVSIFLLLTLCCIAQRTRTVKHTAQTPLSCTPPHTSHSVTARHDVMGALKFRA